MGLLDRLPDSTLGLQGQTPQTLPGALPSSQLHGPQVDPDTSELDLDGNTPEQYMNNLPG